MEFLKRMRCIKFKTSSNEMLSKNGTIKEEEENENDNLLNINSLNLKSNRTKRTKIEEPIISKY